MQLLVTLLKPFIPLAVKWVRDQEDLILRDGRALTPGERDDAVKAGVTSPEKIRILVVPVILPPQGGLLGWASKVVKVFGPGTAGCTLRYGIYIRGDCENYRANRELFVHEFCHVGQFERYGAIHAFLVDYLRECITPGYPHGPLEIQAIRTAARIVRES